MSMIMKYLLLNRVLFFTAILVNPVYSMAIQQVEEAAEYNESGNCIETFSYGNNINNNYIYITTPDGERYLYFDEVAVYEDENKGFLVAFPIFGLSPLVPAAESRNATELLNSLSGRDIEQFFSSIIFSINSDSDPSVRFIKSDLRSIDCVIDMNKRRNQLRDLFKPQSSDFDHQIDKTGNIIVIDFASKWKENPEYSLKIHIEKSLSAEESIIISKSKVRKDNTLYTSIYQYEKNGFLIYEREFAGLEFMPLPDQGKTRSFQTNANNNLVVNKFNHLSPDSIFIEIHQIRQDITDEGNPIENPVMSGSIQPGHWELTGSTITENIASTNIVQIKGEPILIQPQDRPPGEDYYGRHPRIDLYNRPVGIDDLPAAQVLPIKKPEELSYSLVNSGSAGLKIQISESQDGYTFILGRENLDEIRMNIRIQSIKDKAGKHADQLFRFVGEISDRQKLADKDINWFKNQTQLLNVPPPNSESMQDYIRAIGEHYELQPDDFEVILLEHQKTEYSELVDALIFAENAYIEDPRSADMLSFMQETDHFATIFNIEIEETTDYFDKLYEFETKLREKFPSGAYRWAKSYADKQNRTQSKIVITTDKEGKPVVASFMNPHGNRDVLITFQYRPSLKVTLDQSSSETATRSWEATDGLIDINYIFGLLPLLDLSKANGTEIYVSDFQGTTSSYDKQKITPIFNKVTFEILDEESIEFANNSLETIKLRLTFNSQKRRPDFFPELPAINENWQPYMDVWLEKSYPHLPVKLESDNTIFWRGPDPEKKQQAANWQEWFLEQTRQ